jgi:hypothetical protein
LLDWQDDVQLTTASGEIADETRDLARDRGHKVMVQKVSGNETWKAHALAQIEMAKRESKPVPMAL